ncbi:hypothetical protein BdWA1_001400 [Babesia duncani]|uniref:Uncharacterized protein n=1 Tax=Babesia duncani TaxID=323732 RepID=A0AAD9PPL2_9APIC|nr:hypothetical protein BdWA1_001400 [Babesia duncani]
MSDSFPEDDIEIIDNTRDLEFSNDSPSEKLDSREFNKVISTPTPIQQCTDDCYTLGLYKLENDFLTRQLKAQMDRVAQLEQKLAAKNDRLVQNAKTIAELEQELRITTLGAKARHSALSSSFEQVTQKAKGALELLYRTRLDMQQLQTQTALLESRCLERRPPPPSQAPPLEPPKMDRVLEDQNAMEPPKARSCNFLIDRLVLELANVVAANYKLRHGQDAPPIQVEDWNKLLLRYHSTLEQLQGLEHQELELKMAREQIAHLDQMLQQSREQMQTLLEQSEIHSQQLERSHSVQVEQLEHLLQESRQEVQILKESNALLNSQLQTQSKESEQLQRENAQANGELAESKWRQAQLQEQCQQLEACVEGIESKYQALVWEHVALFEKFKQTVGSPAEPADPAEPKFPEAPGLGERHPHY